MRGKRAVFTLLISMGVLSTTWSAPYINADFNTGSGDLATVDADWSKVENTPGDAFTLGGGVATTTGTFPEITNGTRAVYFTGASVGNDIGHKWTGSVDFSFTRTAEYGPDTFDKQLFTLGEGNTETNELDIGQSDLGIQLRLRNTGALRVGVRDADAWNNPLQVSDAFIGATNNTSATTTDDLRLTWIYRKTAVSNVYAFTASIINLDTMETNSMEKIQYLNESIFWNEVTNPRFLLQAENSSYTNDNYVTTAIDSLTVSVESNAPAVLQFGSVVAAGNDAAVFLSWDDVVEATAYDVKRSDSIDGTYTTLTGGADITTNVFSDTQSLVNGNTYFYKITAKAGALSADSDPVEATPDQIVEVTGTFIDTTFTNSAIYANGDLANQTGWRANRNSRSGAFTVDTAGNGFATAVASAASTNEASVYWKDYSTNAVGAIWSGDFDFKITADSVLAEEGVILNFGVTSDVEEKGISHLESHNAVITTWLTPGGNLRIGLNARFIGQTDLINVAAEDLGWDPASTNIPDFETDLIEYDWSIRKTLGGNYNAELTVTVEGISTNTATLQYANNEPTEMYNAGVAHFAMSHRIPGMELVDIAVDRVTVTHADTSPVPVTEPTISSVTQGNLELNVSWGSKGDETGGFNVYRSSTGTDPEDFVLYTNVTTAGFVDTGLENLRVYAYKIKSVFPTGESEFSNMVANRALVTAQVDGMFWSAAGGNGTLNYNKTISQTYSGVSSNGITLKTGNGFEGSKVEASKIDDGYNTSASPLIYGWLQEETEIPVATTTFWNKNGNDRIRYRNNNGGINASLDYVQIDTAVDASVGTFIMYAGTWGGNTRAAIRNNGTWYASKTTSNNDEQSIDMATETWAVFSTPEAGDDYVDVSDGSFATVTFDRVDAVGILRGKNTDTGNKSTAYFSLVIQDRASDFQSAMFDYGLYNEDAAATNDYDGDGVDNVSEWGLGGDPADGSKSGLQVRRTEVDENGNFIYIYPRLPDTELRPTYSIASDNNLTIAPGFVELTEGVDYTEDGYGPSWSTNGIGANFDAVTNTIPTAGIPREFFKLIITE
ncbi:hypothetical protein [Pontiella agarivorans]|uniref:Fibronectin type-III domain-containing protein n=1 Tax=Pontiella agarivorans TaxID=3038953 RepID=A0ABU5MSH1_9BACT|nr:hypothetical protein [Pontiella agarivorans]MDZ8117078.1 hypothetical protein [Pontiella agarivorans]